MPLRKKLSKGEEMDVSDNSSDSDASDVEFDERNEVMFENSFSYERCDHTLNFQEIQVDFEGRNPIDSDFPGIRQLLNQLFLKSDVNVSELADYIIGKSIT